VPNNRDGLTPTRWVQVSKDAGGIAYQCLIRSLRVVEEERFLSVAAMHMSTDMKPWADVVDCLQEGRAAETDVTVSIRRGMRDHHVCTGRNAVFPRLVFWLILKPVSWSAYQVQ
jgi:hypothetical protein